MVRAIGGLATLPLFGAAAIPTQHHAAILIQRVSGNNGGRGGGFGRRRRAGLIRPSPFSPPGRYRCGRRPSRRQTRSGDLLAGSWRGLVPYDWRSSWLLSGPRSIATLCGCTRCTPQRITGVSSVFGRSGGVETIDLLAKAGCPELQPSIIAASKPLLSAPREHSQACLFQPD